VLLALSSEAPVRLGHAYLCLERRLFPRSATTSLIACFVTVGYLVTAEGELSLLKAFDGCGK